MSTRENEPGDLEGVLAALQEVRPAAARIDRDRLLFDAGRRSAKRPWAWQASTVLACLLAAGTGLAWRWSPPDIRTVVVTVPPVSQSQPMLAHLELAPGLPLMPYLELRDTALRTGVPGAAPSVDFDPPERPAPRADSYLQFTSEVGPFLHKGERE
jgi:hypothetical protein